MSQTESRCLQFTDPIEVLEQKQSLLSHHRAAMNDMENELDKEHSDELMELRKTIAAATKETLLSGKSQTLEKLKAQGASDDFIERLIRKHENEMEDLRAQQKEEKERQEERFLVSL